MRLDLSDYKVCIPCMTYNQSKYIIDAMNGFCNQKTTFPFVCVIMDDASNDGEREVIDNYVKMNFDLQNENCENAETEDYTMFFARHKSNTNCFLAVYYLKYNHYSIQKVKSDYYLSLIESSKYIAYCEGDDFWCSPVFLQVAVTFLDEHEDYSAVFGNKLVSDEGGNIISKVRFNRDLSIHDIMRGNNMGLRNLCFRKKALSIIASGLDDRDLHIYYKCAICGKMKYVDCDFGVYRYTGRGVHSCLGQRENIHTSFLHYYEFHGAVNYEYQKDLVYYQILRLLKNIAKTRFVLYTLSLIRKYHAPSRLRFIWYFEALINIIVSSIGKCIRNILLRPKNLHI